jgi:hypothetical protein
MIIDKKAQNILFHTFWSSKGWRTNALPPHLNYSISHDDFLYAKSAGYMFDPIFLSHDDTIKWLTKSTESANLKKISNAFLASLSTRRLDLRSALGSFAFAKNLPLHSYQNWGHLCSVCGIAQSSQQVDLNVLNFERFKWGGVRHANPEYAAFDLEQFNQIEDIKPCEYDLQVMHQILSIIKNCASQTRPRDLEKKLAKVLTSNKAEREILIDILGFCGILQPWNKPGFFDSFVNYSNRTVPPVNKIDWQYPISWWRGSDGINLTAVHYYFPQLQ